MTYDFDALLDRRNSNSIKWDKYGDRDVLPLWVADMDFAIAPEIQQALSDRIKHPVFGYTSASDALYDALIDHLERDYNWSVSRDWIVWMPGVVAGLSACVRAFVPDGGRVMTNPPIYHHFFQVHDPEKHSLKKVPLICFEGRWTYDLKAMESLASEKIDMFMLCSPHNPTGTLFQESELQAVCEIARSCGAIVVSDEIHCGLVLPEQAPHVPTAIAADSYVDNIVTLMSASKTFNLAGLNCSYAIIPDAELRQKYISASVEAIPFVGTLAYTATEAAFTSAESWRQQLLNYLLGNYRYLQDEFATIDGMELQKLEATYLAWIDASGLSLNDTTGFFEQHGVGLSPGEQFGQPQFLRLNFACPRSILVEAVERIRKARALI